MKRGSTSDDTQQVPCGSAVATVVLAIIVLVAGSIASAAAAQQLGSSSGGSPSAGGFVVDTRNRADVVAMFHRIYMASTGAEERIGWTGSSSACDAGRVSDAFLEDVRRRINYFRAMAGVSSTVVLDPMKNAKAQEAALLYSVNGALSHYPKRDFPGWKCLTDDADEAARNSNAGLGGMNGADGVDDFMRDAGRNNAPVGHRRWLLYPRTVEMGVGVVPGEYGAGRPAGRAIWVIGDWAEAGSDESAAVSWPPAGFVPYTVVYPRWSLSMRGANFSGAGVSMEVGGEEVAVRIEWASGRDGTIVWRPEGATTQKPTEDTRYRVTISDFLVGEVRQSVTYEVTVIDPFTLVDAVELTGSLVPVVGRPNRYGFSRIEGATGYEFRYLELKSGFRSEGAEGGAAGTGGYIDGTSVDYESATSEVVRTGEHAFYLTFPSFEDGEQTIELARALVPSRDSELEFYSRFRFATSTSRIVGEVSVDEGRSWSEVVARAGSGSRSSSGWDMEWVRSRVSLAEFAGRVIRVRVRYGRERSVFLGQDGSQGVFVDDIGVTNGSEMVGEGVVGISGAAKTVDFVPASAGVFYLQMRPVLGRHPFSYGSALMVRAAGTVEPDLRPFRRRERLGAGATVPAAVPAAVRSATSGQPAGAQPRTAEQESLFWQSIMNSTDPADFEAYLSQFPNGVFRVLAQNRLSALRGPRPGAGFRPDQTCAGKPAGAACWIEIALQPGCYVWNPFPQTGESVTWTGECAGGLAQGAGTLTWASDESQQTSTGRLQDGQRSGHWVHRWAPGNVEEGPYVDGQRSGHWVHRWAPGNVEEGPYVDGQRSGHWVHRWAPGNVEEGPYVDGERHGDWVVRWAPGNVEEGPYVDGQRSGHWVHRWAPGNVEEGPYVDGQRSGHWVHRWAPGNVEEGPYVDGERHGDWVVRWASGNVEEGPYVDGERHGDWVVRWASGNVEEGPYVDGERHGDWVVRWASGIDVAIARYVNGEIVETR